MAVTQVKGVTVNKLTLDQYRNVKKNNQLITNESYVITDIDEQLDKLIIYKESMDVNNPIILRELPDGLYKVRGYFKYNSNQSGISGADPAALIQIGNSSTTTYAMIVDYSGYHKYEITDNNYKDVNDSGWITPTLTSDFRAYNGVSTNTPQYRKVGNQVEVRGIVQPTVNITGATTEKTIFTLPAGYRPTKPVYEICQGTGRNFWLLTINTNGTVTFSRYGVTSYVQATTSNWLPFNKVFTI